MSRSQLAYRYISAVLKWGSYLAFTISILGLMLFALFFPASPVLSDIGALSLSQLASELFKFKAIAFVNLGLLILMLTPVLRVIVAIFSFALERDLKYTVVASAVLAVLIVSLLVAA